MTVFFGGKGDDYIDGGLGHDYVDAGPGDDRIVVEVGIDTPVIGGKGNDTIELATGFCRAEQKKPLRSMLTCQRVRPMCQPLKHLVRI